MYTSINDFLMFYKKFLIHHWNTMGPQEYLITLLTVGVVGWFMMRKAGST